MANTLSLATAMFTVSSTVMLAGYLAPATFLPPSDFMPVWLNPKLLHQNACGCAPRRQQIDEVIAGRLDALSLHGKPSKLNTFKAQAADMVWAGADMFPSSSPANWHVSNWAPAATNSCKCLCRILDFLAQKGARHRRQHVAQILASPVAWSTKPSTGSCMTKLDKGVLTCALHCKWLGQQSCCKCTYNTADVPSQLHVEIATRSCNRATAIAQSQLRSQSFMNACLEPPSLY
eukprot:353615-Chlamydomonas_euryale.AAC.19